MTPREKLIEKLAETIASVRWDRVEKPNGNTQSRLEHAYYLKGQWLQEAEAIIDYLKLEVVDSNGIIPDIIYDKKLKRHTQAPVINIDNLGE